jgi:hypothetical protein
MSEYSLLFVVFIIAALLKLPGALVGFVAVVLLVLHWAAPSTN